MKLFSANYERFSLVEPAKIKRATVEVQDILKRFMSRGRDAYSYARSVEEARDIYRSQKRALNTAVEAAASIAPRSQNILANERAELEKLKHFLAKTENGLSETEIN